MGVKEQPASARAVRAFGFVIGTPPGAAIHPAPLTQPM